MDIKDSKVKLLRALAVMESIYETPGEQSSLKKKLRDSVDLNKEKLSDDLKNMDSVVRNTQLYMDNRTNYSQM